MNDRDRILVTGGTGALGRVLVSRLMAAGRRVRVVSRRPRRDGDPAADDWAVADPISGTGMADAVADVGVLVHCATAFGRRKELELVRAVVDAANRAGTPHLVYISIVGVDRVPLGYYRGKLAAEQLIEDSGVPYSIQRATQFHDLIRVLFAAAAKFPIMFVPGFRFQPIDVRDVADRIAELAAGVPLGRAADIAGPQVRDARDLARAYLATTGRRRPVVPVWLPGKVFRAYRRDGHLAPEHAYGEITFEAYLADHPDPRRASYR